MRNAVSAARAASVEVSVARCGSSNEVWPWPKPSTGTGCGTPSSRARFALITTSAAPPSETSAQSSRADRVDDPRRGHVLVQVERRAQLRVRVAGAVACGWPWRRRRSPRAACRARSCGGGGSSRSRPRWRTSRRRRRRRAGGRRRRGCRCAGCRRSRRAPRRTGPASMAMMANDSSVMLAAPPWSHAPPMRGVMPSASATFWPYMNWCAEVGTFTNTASTTDLSMPASASALPAGLDVERDRVAAGQLAERGVADAGDDVAAAQAATCSFPVNLRRALVGERLAAFGRVFACAAGCG